MRELRIVHYTTARMSNEYKHDLTFLLFHTARNAIINCCRNYGTFGPFGVFNLDGDCSDVRSWFNNWEKGDLNSDFYILDDQYNNETYHHAELQPNAASSDWIYDLNKCLKLLNIDIPDSNWGLCVTNINRGYMIIFSDSIHLTGEVFDSCNDIEQILSVLKKELV